MTHATIPDLTDGTFTAGATFLVAHRVAGVVFHIRYTVIDAGPTWVKVIRDEGRLDDDGALQVSTTHRPTWRRDALTRLYAQREV